jgi:hypothetical protein
MALKLLRRIYRIVGYLINTNVDLILELILRLGDASIFLLYFGQMIVSIGLINPIH